MAIYRSIHTTFWEDTKVADDFTPEDKYFMLYCLTNSHTNLCGCYEISIKQMARDLGYNEETVKKLIERFTNVHKIIFYDETNKELLIKNWHKYNWTTSNKLDKPLLKELENIKTADFKRFVADLYNKRYTVSIPYIYTMDTTVTVAVSNTITNSINNINNNSINSIDKEKKSDDHFHDTTKNVFQFYEENIGSINPVTAELLISYLDDMPEEMIIEAIKIACLQNVRKPKYIGGILDDWRKKGYKVLADIEGKNKTEVEEDERIKKRDEWRLRITKEFNEKNERK